MASDASHKTVKRRVDKVKDMRETVNLEVEDEIRALSSEKRQALLKETSLPLVVPIDHSLAIKSSLSISWNKLRKLRR